MLINDFISGSVFTAQFSNKFASVLDYPMYLKYQELIHFEALLDKIVKLHYYLNNLKPEYILKYF